jgi:two-component system chemotaxis response regulator CheY
MDNELIDLLIVDDSAAIRKILQRVLQQTELPIGKVFEASDGCQALDLLRQNPVTAVLVDVNMPNMDGLEFLRTVRGSAQWKNLPVVMVTTEGSQARVQEAVELGAAGYVRKPFTTEQIRSKLTALFAR